MKNKLLAQIAQSAAALFSFAASASADTASVFGMYQPKVPDSLKK